MTIIHTAPQAPSLGLCLRIWKYPLEITDSQPVPMPTGARILTVQVQHGQPCLWALVDPTRASKYREIRMVGTGHPADGLTNYIGTFQADGGALVFHVFEASA